jgi:hypothetical protein
VAEVISDAGASRYRELGSAVAGGIKGNDDVWKLLPRLDPASIRSLVETLVKRAPKILASTTVIMPDHAGEAARFELGKEKDRNAVFNEHPEAFLPILIFAGKVTFERFFPVIAQPAGETPNASS